MARTLNALTVMGITHAFARPSNFKNRDVGWEYAGYPEAPLHIVGRIPPGASSVEFFLDVMAVELHVHNRDPVTIFRPCGRDNLCDDGPYRVGVERSIAGDEITVGRESFRLPVHLDNNSHRPWLILLSRVFEPGDEPESFVARGKGAHVIFHQALVYQGRKVLRAAAILPDPTSDWLGIKFSNLRGAYVEAHYSSYMTITPRQQFDDRVAGWLPENAVFHEVPCSSAGIHQ